ncbi:MAG: hypothetical protein GOV01_03305 [Candidatus Altiarchaeota archaeon]|nr:hypothetical protein [Candidatus Altiarchaeota archaeon]
MKFGIIPKGPTDQLTERANKLNPDILVMVVDNTTYNDPDLFAVFVFKPYRAKADKFNAMREKEKTKPFAIVDVPLSKPKYEVRNSVRARIVEILKDEPAYGYQIYKKYKATYGNISIRLIYYHLTRGKKDGLFEIAEIKESEGDFSWGMSTRHKYYRLTASFLENSRKPTN